MILRLERWFYLKAKLRKYELDLDIQTTVRGVKRISKKIEETKKMIEELDTKNCDHIFIDSKERVYDVYTSWNYSTECVKCGLSDQFLGDSIYREADCQFRELSRNGSIRKYMLFDDNKNIDINYAKQKYIEALYEAKNPLDREEIVKIMKYKINEDEVRKMILARAK